MMSPDSNEKKSGSHRGVLMMVIGGENGETLMDLLPDHVGIVARVDLEAAVVGPEINRRADTGNTTLVDLHRCQRIAP